MSSLNINRNVSDRFYRYKMPPLIAKVEGKGNGIKTVIVNISEIGKSLSRPPTYLTKYFGCEFGAQTKCDVKNDRYIVNGAHEGDKLQEALDGFIKKFVLCPECNNPETELYINSKKQIISQSCKACGYVGSIDPHHRLTAFILKNPIEDSDDKKAKAGNKRNKRTEIANANANGKINEETHEENHDESGISNFGGLIINEASTASENNKKILNVTELDAFEDDWSSEQPMNDAAARYDGDNASLNENINKFYHYMKDLKAKGKVSEIGIDKLIFNEAETMGIKDKAPVILVEILLNQDAISQIASYRMIFLRFCHGNVKAQKHLMGAIERLAGKEYPDLMNKIPHILKALYDADLLEEAMILDWAAKVSKKYVDKDTALNIRKKAAPFIKWLKEAESEEDEQSNESGSYKQINIKSENNSNEVNLEMNATENNDFLNGDVFDDTNDLSDSKLREKHVKRGAILHPRAKPLHKGDDSDLDIDAI